MDTDRITLAPPSPSSVRVTMDADDPRRLRLIGLGWHQTGPLDVCGLRQCHLDAAYEVVGGADHFTSKQIVGACAFHRAEIMDRMGSRWPYVTWRDR